MAPLPPAGGASIRTFVLPPDDVTAGTREVPLGQTPSLFVATVVSGRAHLVLETGEVVLDQGDSFVLPGSVHGWRNPSPEPALIVCAVFPLAGDR
jgi:quercetin dioxygenase-like cupin family protein